MNLYNYKGYRIRIEPDENSESPDKWENDDVFLIYQHRQFTIERAGFDVHEINKAEDEYYIFPVEAYIHSGISLSLFNGTRSCRFDSSVSGYVLVRKTSFSEEDSVKVAESLISDWNMYLNGEVYGYIIEKPKTVYSITKEDFDKELSEGTTIRDLESKFSISTEWEEVDSCWGYYGDPNDTCLSEAKNIIDNY